MTDLASAFERSVDEGNMRLHRSLPVLLATGAVGGIDVGLGVFSLLLVRSDTHSVIAGALAFSAGFIALTLAHSELFTENFLVPIAALVARKATVGDLARLWLGTLSTNLLGGWVFMGIVMLGFPSLHATARSLASHYMDAGINLHSFATAVIGGTVITVMTWMERGSASTGGKIVAAIVAAFLLAVGSLNHVIVMSLVIFAGLAAHAPFGYLTWAEVAGWATLGNLVGGLGLVTVLRLVQVGGEKLKQERDRPDGTRRDPDTVALRIRQKAAGDDASATSGTGREGFSPGAGGERSLPEIEIQAVRGEDDQPAGSGAS
ncbi:MAG: formate/nitrite transporter family protein [Actinomycetota bacterium]|nr:formate/nitrite transporter family protein [Actinomycetota bacterium]